MNAAALRLALACALMGAAGSCLAQAPSRQGAPEPARAPLSFPLTPEGDVDRVAKPSAKEILDSTQGPISGDPLANGSRSGEKRPVVSAEALAKLDALAASANYESIRRYAQNNSTDPKLSEWLLSHAQGGDVMLMWELADRYLRADLPGPAIQWAYAGLLGVMQERSLCLDQEVEFAASKIALSHARLIKVARANPFMIKDAKTFAMATLSKAPRYPAPEAWLCKPFAHPARQKDPRTVYAYDPLYYPYLRAKAHNELRRTLGMGQATEPQPPLPSAPSKPSPKPPTTP